MIEEYNKYKYIYPPRVELKIHRDNLDFYDNGTFIGEPKLNGSNCCLFVNDNKYIQKGRHNNTLSIFNLLEEEIMDVFSNKGWNNIIGEYMNKSKKDENNEVFNHKFVIFDQIVFNSEYLLDSTFNYRYEKLLDIYKPIGETEFLYKISDNIYMVKGFYDNIGKVWDKITKIDMFEGLVMKRKNGKLKRGTSEKNNHMTMFKVRKENNSYLY